jgi:hypothetical protein
VGGIGLWYRLSAWYVFVECDNDGGVTLFYSDPGLGGGTIVVGYEDETMDALIEKIAQLLDVQRRVAL